jgi:hypothetical protein
MTNVEYLLKVDTIRREASREVQRLGREYALANNPIRVGDVVQDHKGLIVVAEIGVFYADVPYCLYTGERVTQKGAPFIRGGERTVHQCNVTRYKAAGFAAVCSGPEGVPELSEKLRKRFCVD